MTKTRNTKIIKTPTTKTRTGRDPSKFQKGSGVYKCRMCGKRTRSTGRGDNENCELCVTCFDKASDENTVSDGQMTKAEFDEKWNAPATKASKLYTGAPIVATKLFSKPMDAFKNCSAVCFMAWNEQAQTVTYINAYGKKGSDVVQPRASFDPTTYTYPAKMNIINKKMAEMAEIDAPEWPSFVQIAPPANMTTTRRTRKAK